MTTKNDIERLFRSNYKAMLHLATRLTHDSEVAGDIVHDVFHSLLSKGTISVTPAYLINGVRFACLKYIRNMSVRDRLNRLYALDCSDVDEGKWPDEESVELIRTLVETKLSGQCRRVVRMRFGANMKYHEIAEELCISEAAVYKHLRHALIVLRQNLKEK